MRVPDAIRDCVGFIGILEGSEPVWGGTCFLTGIKGPSGLTHIYLVTARHVAENCEPDFIITFNDRTGKAIALQDENGARWTYHPSDRSVDVAVTPITLDRKIFNTNRFIDESMYVTKQRARELDIGPGNEAFMTGLFTKVTGRKVNIPIVRMGSIAMMPEEKIPWGDHEVDAYLIESRSIGGLSGSPVFVRETLSLRLNEEQLKKLPPDSRDTPTFFVGQGNFYFLGVSIGHWALSDRYNYLEQEKVNMGVCVVVPCDKLLEVLNHPQLVEGRSSAAERNREKRKADESAD